MTTRPKWRRMAAASLMVTVGCTHAARTPALPKLLRIVPDSVRFLPGNVTEIMLEGRGFDQSASAPANTVRIGSVVLHKVPSTDKGTRIRVVVPADQPRGGEAPPAPWMSGRYPVIVTTPAGTTAALQLFLLVGGGIPR